jgi:GNAT superfamily N-acetyltransferase
MQIQLASPSEAPAISALISALAPFCTLSPDGAGAEGFFDSISPEAIAGYIGAPNFRYRSAWVDGQLAAVVAMRDNTHLYHLFVAAPFHRRGIARQLWELARREAVERGNPGRFTVNSTVFAVPMYESFGFRCAGARQEANGIAFVPMERVEGA